MIAKLGAEACKNKNCVPSFVLMFNSSALCRLDINSMFKIRAWERYRFMIDYENQQVVLLAAIELRPSILDLVFCLLKYCYSIRTSWNEGCQRALSYP